jgi:hypothetical protein
LAGTIPVEWVDFFDSSSCALLAAAVGMPELAAVVVGVTGAGLAREGSVTVICTGARSAVMVVSKAAVDGWATGGGARVGWATDGRAIGGWAPDGWATGGWVNGGWATDGWATEGCANAGWAIDGWWFWSSRKGGAWGGGDRVADVDAPVSGGRGIGCRGRVSVPATGLWQWWRWVVVVALVE